MTTISESCGWILKGQVCEIIDETDYECLLECFDGYDGTIKREWVARDLIVEE